MIEPFSFWFPVLLETSRFGDRAYSEGGIQRALLQQRCCIKVPTLDRGGSLRRQRLNL